MSEWFRRGTKPNTSLLRDGWCGPWGDKLVSGIHRHKVDIPHAAEGGASLPQHLFNGNKELVDRLAGHVGASICRWERRIMSLMRSVELVLYTCQRGGDAYKAETATHVIIVGTPHFQPTTALTSQTAVVVTDNIPESIAASPLASVPSAISLHGVVGREIVP